MNIINLLNQPFPVNSWRWYRLRGIGFGLFVFLFLLLFKPFRLDLYSSSRLFYIAAMYGIVTGAVILLGGFLFIKVIASYINEEKWTLGKQILLNILLMIGITIFNVLVTQLVHQIVLPIWWHFYMLKWVLMLGVFPVVISELFSYNYYLRLHIKSAENLSNKIPAAYTAISSPSEVPELSNLVINNIHLKPKNVTTSVAEKESISVHKRKAALIMLTGDNQNDRLEIPPYRLLAVQSLDNYVNVFWENNNKLQTTLLRNTLSNIAEQLNGIPFMYRCHRGWLVNTQKVRQVSGNAQGLKLTVDLLHQPVPVSRANITGYREIAEQYMAMKN